MWMSGCKTIMRSKKHPVFIKVYKTYCLQPVSIETWTAIMLLIVWVQFLERTEAIGRLVGRNFSG